MAIDSTVGMDASGTIWVENRVIDLTKGGRMLGDNVYLEQRETAPNSPGFLARDRIAREIGLMSNLEISRFVPTAQSGGPDDVRNERIGLLTRADLMIVIVDATFDPDLDTLLSVAQVLQRPVIFALPNSLKDGDQHRHVQWVVGQATTTWHTDFAFFKDGDCMGAAASIVETVRTMRDKLAKGNPQH